MFYIQNNAWNKIIGYSEHAYETEKSEIGGMSVVVKDKDGDWEIKKPVILKQEISTGNTVLDKDALANYYTKTAKIMGDEEYRFCWWHSHHTMKAFWSSTDLKAIDEFNEGDFSFALVVNLKEEYKFRVSVWEPFEVHSDEELTIYGKTKVTKAIKKEVEALCTKEKPFTYTRPTHMYNGSMKKSTTYADGWPEYDNQRRLPLGEAMLTKKPKHVNEVIEDVDELNTDLIAGTISYPLYKEGIEKLNEELKKEDSLYQVRLLPENQKEKLLHLFPYKFVEYKTSGMNIYGSYNDDPLDDWWDDDMYEGMVY